MRTDSTTDHDASLSDWVVHSSRVKQTASIFPHDGISHPLFMLPMATARAGYMNSLKQGLKNVLTLRLTYI